ncbi:XdhC family protein [Microbacterium sp. NPDC089180]|uniref:XdhC family protein n=1 Tax=Microbacterium galbum TaxID=3075994 RepID=A0ABU3T5M6_9MICO|nr:XdhC family protein [Microbacterium sp. KSW4-17]MDU0366644.1 XdhC family protein [Microbacterium sp. KSW4-17]
MLDLAADLVPLMDAGVPLAAVTVTAVVRSAPRGVGATLVVTRDARVIGSISGGCVENDAVMLGLDALRTGHVRRARFGFTDDGTVTPIAAGLACGGAVDVVAYPLDDSVRPALEAARAGRKATVRLDLDGGPVVLERPAAPRLIVLGAGEHAAALCRLGSAAGFRVTVCDDWALLATRERFPDAAEVVVAAPHEYLATVDDADERTAVCVLTHDERLDIPALRTALRMPVGFVGAMGARATVARRAQLLRNAGVTDAELSRLHSPLGLDLGGASAEETALSVIAEIVASRNAASARPLREKAGARLHGPGAAGHGPSSGARARVSAADDAGLACGVRTA